MMLLGREVVSRLSTNRMYYNDTVDHAILITSMVVENRERVQPLGVRGAQGSMPRPGTSGLPIRTGLYQHGEFQHDYQLYHQSS